MYFSAQKKQNGRSESHVSLMPDALLFAKRFRKLLGSLSLQTHPGPTNENSFQTGRRGGGERLQGDQLRSSLCASEPPSDENMQNVLVRTCGLFLQKCC